MAPQIHDQTNILPRARLLIVFTALASTMLITYIDQSSIGIMLPTIGRELNCASTIVWASTSSMIANTAFQVLYGRLSDIFGRKHIMLSALGSLALCRFTMWICKVWTTIVWVQSHSRISERGIMAICMIIVSAIVTLEERGK
jgi:MFS family permease